MIRVLLTLLLTTLAGCSWNTYANGSYGEILRYGVPRKTIVAQLGSPASTEYTPDGPFHREKRVRNVLLRVDRYFTKEKIADYHKGSGTGELAGMTLGISELFNAPYALFDQYVPRTRQLELIYDEDGTLRNYRLSK